MGDTVREGVLSLVLASGAPVPRSECQGWPRRPGAGPWGWAAGVAAVTRLSLCAQGWTGSATTSSR